MPSGACSSTGVFSVVPRTSDGGPGLPVFPIRGPGAKLQWQLEPATACTVSTATRDAAPCQPEWACRSEHEGRIPRNHRPARKDEESPGTGPMIEGKSDSEKGSWLFKPRVFFQFEFKFFSLGLWYCSEYIVVPTTGLPVGWSAVGASGAQRDETGAVTRGLRSNLKLKVWVLIRVLLVTVVALNSLPVNRTELLKLNVRIGFQFKLKPGGCVHSCTSGVLEAAWLRMQAESTWRLQGV